MTRKAKDPRPLQSDAEIKRWADDIRAERVSDSGRRLIDLAERALHDALKSEDSDSTAKLYTAIDKLVRAAFQADKQLNDNTMQDLERRRAEGDALAEQLNAPLQ